MPLRISEDQGMTQPMTIDLANLSEFTDDTSEAPAMAAQFLKSLAHRDRLKILCCLVEGEASVSVLEDKIGISQSAVSQHLLKLKAEGILTSRRDGRMVYYAINDPLVLNVVSLLYERFCGVA